MPCGPSVPGGPNSGAQNGPGEEGGGRENASSSATPNTSSSPNAISTVSSDPALQQGTPAPFSTRPPLPPPPRPHCIHGRTLGGPGGATASNDADAEGSRPDRSRPWWRSWNRKYVLLCGMCGLSSLLLGSFYLVIYFVLRSYTSSLQFFQTMPTYIPACVLMATGLLVLCFMRRKHRVSILIKLVGFLCLVCAVVCVVVTVTTTVLHMNRLQTLKECTFYTQLHSCTCLPFTEEEPFELILDIHITTCDVIHGPLYSCLRAMFGVSVIGILVSIFSCMLVYQLLSHEKKKMYWEQLENRRRFLYRRAPAPVNNNCNCCDEYGFVPPSELYPWRMWESMDERYWAGGPQLYSPAEEESSNASRSVLLGGNNPSGAPSLWLPWGGAWGASHSQGPQQNQPRDPSTPGDSAGTSADPEGGQSDDLRPQTTGVLLRPFLPRGLEARFGLRRQPPPPPSHGRRPLSDPGVALQLPRYPPTFSEAFLPPLPYEGLEAFSRLMWDPPPPYSQPASQENLHEPPSPGGHPLQVISSPSRRPPGIPHILRGAPTAPGTEMPSPTDVTDQSGSPAHFSPVLKEPSQGDTGSLPLNHHHRFRRLPLGHVKSLGDVTEATRESLEVLLCHGKDLASLEKFASHGDVTQRLLALKARHLKGGSDPRASYGKGGSDPRGVYGKGEQESELYFADVSSCVSLRQDEILYYSEPASHKSSPGGEGAPRPSSKEDDNDRCSPLPPHLHLYEQVRPLGDAEDAGADDGDSHHTSDDTMIVHTSSSDHSLGLEAENTYSVASPLTDHSSASPMATDTDAYSCCYQAPSPEGAPPHSVGEGNLNLHLPLSPHSHRLQQQPPGRSQYPPRLNSSHTAAQHGHPHRYNDNECPPCSNDDTKEDPCYESIPDGDTVIPGFLAPSDLNGNVALSTGGGPQPRTALTLPLRRVLPEGGVDTSPPESEATAQGRRSKGSHDRSNFRGSEPSTPDRRLQSVQDHLFTLKSVNV